MHSGSGASIPNRASWRISTSFPGGDLVDGQPPACRCNFRAEKLIFLWLHQFVLLLTNFNTFLGPWGFSLTKFQLLAIVLEKVLYRQRIFAWHQNYDFFEKCLKIKGTSTFFEFERLIGCVSGWWIRIIKSFRSVQALRVIPRGAPWLTVHRASQVSKLFEKC